MVILGIVSYRLVSNLEGSTDENRHPTTRHQNLPEQLSGTCVSKDLFKTPNQHRSSPYDPDPVEPRFPARRAQEHCRQEYAPDACENVVEEFTDSYSQKVACAFIGNIESHACGCTCL